jgi:VanZ family protein
MRFHSHRERRLWLLAGLLLLLSWSTLSVAPSATDWLRGHGLLTSSMVLIVAPLVVAVIWDLRRSRAGWREWVVLAIVAMVLAALSRTLTGPEEAMHFVQYGLFAVLVYGALEERRRATTDGPSSWIRHPALTAVAFTALAGWVDEGIQYLLPNRYYDLRDVAFNAGAGALAVVALAGRKWARRPTRR